MIFGFFKKHAVSVVCALITVAMLAVVSLEENVAAQSTPVDAPFNTCSDNWDPRFFTSGPNQGSIVNTVVRDSSGSVFMAGNFTTIDGVPTSRVARWDGRKWIQVGNGLNGFVQTLAFAPNGILYAGGSFTASGNGTAMNRIARLNGASWEAVGDGFDGGVTSITFDSNGIVYAGGSFTASGSTAVSRVARWDGKSWKSLGIGINGSVLTLLWTPQGLVAGGSFTESEDGASIPRIAQWDGFYWRPVGGGLNSAVRSLIWDKNSLVAVGDFSQTLSPVAPISKVARFDGEKWIQIGDGLNNSVVTVQRDSFDDLWVIGTFTSSGSESGLASVAKLSGERWGRVANGIAAGFSVNGIAPLPNGEMILGGSFTSVGGNASISRITRWNGRGFERMTSSGLPVDGTVNAIAEDSSGNIYVAGGFLNAGNIATNRIAKWDGISWSTLSTGMNGTVNTLLFDPQGNLLAGGNFTTAGGVTVNRIARWNGTAWQPLATGLNGSVQTMTFGPDGNLYVGGNFTAAGTVTGLNRIARWDGTNWNAIGAGFSATVNAIAFSPTGTMFAGGSFIVTGDRLAAYIARFDPVEGWFGIGDGMSGPVRALAFNSQGRLYIAGDFVVADKIEVNRIVYFENNIFTSVGAGVNGSISVMRLGSNDEIHIAGNFTESNGKTVRRFSRWNGSEWLEIGDGINEQVLAMLRSSSGDFYLGGFFTQTGCKNSPFFARYVTNGFTGTTSTGWHTTTNWSSNSVPTATSSVRIPTGNVAISSSSAVVKDLYIAEGATLDVASGRTLTISGELTLHGSITGSGTVIIQSCSVDSLSRPLFSVGVISASLQRCVTPTGSYLFPMGESGTSASVVVSGANSNGNVTFATSPQAQTNATGLPSTRFARTWTATSTGITAANIEFSYPDASVNGVVETSARIYRTNSGTATALPTSLDAFNNIATTKQTPVTGTWTIAQSSTSCDPVLGNIPTRLLSSNGETLSVSVTAPSDCVWRVTSRSNWITATPDDERQGNATISIVVGANTGRFREGSVTFGLTSALFSQLPTSSLSGRVTYYSGESPATIGNVSISASGSVVKSTLTSTDGTYSMDDFGLGPYTITATKSGEVNGISSADASLALMYVSGLVDLNFNQRIAADVTGDGTVSAFDASRIARYAVGLGDTGLAGTWRFLPPSLAFSSMEGTMSGQDFVAVLIGDVTGDWTPLDLPISAKKQSLIDSISMRNIFGGSPAFLRKSSIIPTVGKIDSDSGENISVPINIGDLASTGAYSFEMELKYDSELFAVDQRNPIDVLGTLSVNHRLAVNLNEPGIIRIAAFGTLPFTGNGELLRINLQTLEPARVMRPFEVIAFRLNETLILGSEKRQTVR